MLHLADGLQPFLEAIRQVQHEVGRENCVFIHVTLVPYISGSNEHKSKPTQHSVKELMSFGIQPDIIVTRSDEKIDESVLDKIALFCNVKRDCVIENITLPSLYEAPVMLEENGLAEIVIRELNLRRPHASRMEDWNAMLARMKQSTETVTVALVGKYVKLHDAYLSVAEALHHAGFENLVKVDIRWIDSELITAENAAQTFAGVQAIIVPGGFGDRGIEGMITSATYAREHHIPYFGICLGMQILVTAYARSVLGWQDANSTEFDPETAHPVIDFMPDQNGDIPKGGTMRLGAYPCKAVEGSKLAEAYGTTDISERHRHRYEFNNVFRSDLEKAGLVVSGTSPDGRLVEVTELPQEDFYLGVQYHPEFKSRPNRAHPLFREFIAAAKRSRV